MLLAPVQVAQAQPSEDVKFSPPVPLTWPRGMPSKTYIITRTQTQVSQIIVNCKHKYKHIIEFHQNNNTECLYYDTDKLSLNILHIGVKLQM